MKNNDIYDFRMNNIIIITKNINQYDTNFGKEIINTNPAKKSKIYKNPVKFYNDDEIKIIENFPGKIIACGKYSGKVANNYRLIEVIATKERYYEMFIGSNNSTEELLNKFSFIFEIQSLNKVLHP